MAEGLPARKKVIVIDEEADLLKRTARRLKRLGARAVTASCGTEALAVLSVHMPSLILIGYRLPDMTGLDIVRWIRDNEKLRGVPVVGVTAGDAGADVLAAFTGAGCDAHLTKPFDSKRFLATVRKYI